MEKIITLIANANASKWNRGITTYCRAFSFNTPILLDQGLTQCVWLDLGSFPSGNGF